MSRSMRSPQRRPGGPRRPRPIVLIGIDGAGKTTTATALADVLRACGRGAVVMRNRSGRRWLLRAADRLGRPIPARWSDRVETVVRTVNVLTAHARAAFTRRVAIMDRHLVCQLVLRTIRDLPPGHLLPWLSTQLLSRATVVVLDVPAEVARARILARGQDEETLEYLRTARAAYLRVATSHGWLIFDATGTTGTTLTPLGRFILDRPE